MLVALYCVLGFVLGFACTKAGYVLGKRYANRFYASKFVRCERCSRICIATNPQSHDAPSDLPKSFTVRRDREL